MVLGHHQSLTPSLPFGFGKWPRARRRPWWVEGLLGNRVVGVPRDPVLDQLQACPAGPTCQHLSASLPICQADGNGKAGSVDLVAGWDRAAPEAVGDACGAQSLHAKGNDSQVAKGDRLGVGEEATTPCQGLRQVIAQTSKHRDPHMI